MKKFLGLLMMLFSLQVYAGTISMDIQEKKPVNIELHKGSVSDDDRHPRTLLIPITCVYMDGMVQLTLLGEIEEFTFTVTNQTTGEHWSIRNSLVLATSIASGTYCVEVETGDGNKYYGSYIL